jgi:hypothetical protein
MLRSLMRVARIRAWAATASRYNDQNEQRTAINSLRFMRGTGDDIKDRTIPTLAGSLDQTIADAKCHTRHDERREGCSASDPRRQ